MQNQSPTLDPTVWRALPNGGHVKRVYTYTGESRGVACRFPVTLGSANPSVPGYYACQARAAANVHYAPDWVNLRDLTELL